MASEEELTQARKAHASKLAAASSAAYPNGLRVDPCSRQRAALCASDETACAALPEEADLPPNAECVSLYGRVVAKRGPFVVIRTPHGDVQALVRKDRLSEDEAAQLAVLDLSDHVIVEGPLIRTRSGAAAVRADRYQHASKALLPPPAKWHGLKDVETRYRERYVDLFANPDVAQVFRARTRVVATLREFLDARDFLEVETPLLHSVRGGATARPFRTHHNALDLSLFLRIAPELYLKRLLVGGFERVYELARCFRNEGLSTRHNPEFTMLEFYAAYATHEELMDLSESLLRSVDEALLAQFPQFARDRKFTLDTFKRVTLRDALAERLRRSGEEGLAPTPFDGQLDQASIRDAQAFDAACEELGDRLPGEGPKVLRKCRSYGERLFALYELLVEDDLQILYRTPDSSRSVPVFITEYPCEVSPLARRQDADPRFVDRFELFIEGREVANAFSELNDPEDQAARFRAQLDNREHGDEEAMDFDADYIRALSYGMPPAAGFGLGVDRLVMTLCGQASIRDVLLFPLMRPESK